MSVNITVNGKCLKTYQKHEILADPERVKKENENQRRKMRIQQVRDVSNNIAKKVRKNLELEKEKQLKNIEEIKAQEMEMWRQNVLAQKEKDFRSAIFQVGTAHRAAQVENARKAKTPRKIVKKSLNRSKPFVLNSKSFDKENILKNVNVQTDITGKCFPGPQRPLKEKVKKSLMPHNLEISSEWEDNIIESSLGGSTSSSLTSSDSEVEDYSKLKEVQRRKNKIEQLIKDAPPIRFEIEDTDSSLNHENETPKHSKATLEASQKSILNLSMKANKKEESKTVFPAKRRFTQISDIIRQQKSSDNVQQSSTSEFQKSPIKPQTNIRSKSPGNSRPISTQTAEILASKSTSSRSTNTRVQFYDYNNKFHKEYIHHSTVELHESGIQKPGNEMNAMEHAALEVNLHQAKEAEMDKLRQKSSERCQKAIEREQVRRACEELTAKLDAINKQRPLLPSDNHHFASHRLNQIAKEKETKLTNAVEDILKRPAIITCPVIDDSKTTTHEPSIRHPKNHIKGLNLNSDFAQSGSTSFNSSDSCGSILLGHVENRSKQIADDILRFKSNQDQGTDSAKARKLQDLLNRINKLRENLMRELEKCSVDQPFDKNRVQSMLNSISEFGKEHEIILIDNTTKESIEKRENDLKNKEAILEKKLREFYEIHKAEKRKKQLESIENQKISLANEVKAKESTNISHKTNTQNLQKESIYDNKTTEPKAKQIKDDEKGIGIKETEKTEFSSSEEDEFSDHQEIFVDKKPVKIIIKVNGDTKTTKKAKKLPSKSPRKLSTLIQSPALKKTRPKLTTARSIDSNSTSYKSLPSKIHNNLDKFMGNISKTSPTQNHIEIESKNKSEKDHNKKLKKKSSNLNPLMAHYVQRLLGMSRSSIDALKVSSSDIDTPSNSIINTTANLSAADTEKLASARLENVEKFISDNYSFVDELEESLRQSNSTDSSLKTVEVAWKKALKEVSNKKNEQQTKKPLKPSLKTPPRKQKPQPQPHKEHKKPISFVDKSTQMTDNCTQRIAELTAMINKVRKEKQKILETTLSSASENGRNSTEYLDLPDRQNNSNESTSRILDSQLVKSIEDNLPIQLSEPIPSSPAHLVKDKLTGMSRDSGISLSRPITVQETRESPVDDLPQVQSSTESLSGQIKTPKPPISIARYSPQLPEDIPHELSTIFEVDTPATSRLNTSVQVPAVQNSAPQAKPSTNLQDTSTELKDHQAEKITYRMFPSFEKYAQMNNLDATQFDPEFSLQFEKELNEFINLAKEGKNINYEEFTSFNQYIAKSTTCDSKEAAEELLASLKLANLSFKKFPNRKEYLNKMGISESDLLNSQSLDNVENSKQSENSSSSSSLMNIENELKLRNILTKPFRQHFDQQSDDKVSSLIGSSSKNLQIHKKLTEISGIIEFTSTDEQSSNLEEDLKRMGINWPSAMRKKTLETQALSSSTSSNVERQSVPTPRRKNKTANRSSENNFQKRAEISQDTTLRTEDGGQQLNLREFLKKELLKRTATSSSFSFSDDSVASSILRSILGSMTPSDGHQTNKSKDMGVRTLERHKTSTPMASQSVSSAKVGSKSQAGSTSIQLFSGESKLSSVHFGNNTTDDDLKK